MKRIIAGGTGYVGRCLTDRWLAQGHEITIIGRSPKKIKDIFGDTVTALSWADFHANPQQCIAHTQAVINLVGANISTSRWSEKRKQEILDSRINATQALAQACANLADHSPQLFNASAIGVYGLSPATDEGFAHTVDERTQIDFDNAPDFLSEVGRKWEKTTQFAKAHGVRVVNLRFAVVLGPGGGALSKMTFPYKIGLGGPIGSGKQAFSWIHIEDLARSIEFLFDHNDINGPVNIVSPNCVMQKDFAKAMGKVLHRPSFYPTFGFLIKGLFGQMGEELLLKGQHVLPTILQEQGFEFRFPSIIDALTDIFSD